MPLYTALAFDGVSYRVRCIDDEVEDDLAQIAGDALDGWQVQIEVRGYFSDKLPGMFRNQDRVADQMVQVNCTLGCRSWMGQLLHCANNFGNTLYAFQGLLNGFGYLRLEVFDIDFFCKPDGSIAQARYCLCVLGWTFEFLVSFQKCGHALERV